MELSQIFQIKKEIYCLIVFMSLVFFSGCLFFDGYSSDLYPDSFGSNYQYEVSFSSNQSLSNVTMLIPCPVRDKMPIIGNLRMNSSILKKGYYKIEKRGAEVSPEPGFSLNVIKVNNSWLLEVQADFLPRNVFYAFNVGDYIRRPKYSYYAVQTRDPLGNESVFLPKTNLTTRLPDPPTRSDYMWIYHYPLEISYTIPVYAEYRGPEGSELSITSRVESSNSWLQESERSVMNEYSDRFSGRFSGERPGWYLVNGTLTTGRGFYFDPALNTFV
jgi:hypothetical protein